MARTTDDPTDDAPTDDQPATTPEPGDDVLIVEKPAGGLMCAPSIVEGRLSGSGKTIIVEEEEGTGRGRQQLDAETIFTGGLEARGATWYTLYSVEEFQSKQRANKAPGPQAGANQVSDAAALPTATHQELDEYTPAAEEGDD